MQGSPSALANPAVWAARWRERVFRHSPADGSGVRLGHSRIYILPTRRGLALIATIATIIVTSLNYGLALGFVAAFLLTGLIGAALLHTFRNVCGLALEPGPVGEAFAGGRMSFPLVLNAGTRPRAAVALSSGATPLQFADVEAGIPQTLTLDCDATRRGRLALGRITVASDFPLGLWRAWAYAHFAAHGIVYPAPEPSPPPVPARGAGVNGSGNGASEDADLTGLRTYQPGDPPQRVAWKAVARRAGWYTKEFEGTRGGGPVMLDLAELPATMTLEQKLSRLCAWTLACERAGRPYGLALPQTRIAIGQGREHRRRVLTALALFDRPQR